MNAASPFGSREVERTREVARIAALPRRVWTEEASAQLAAMLTRELKTPGGSQSLRPVQAIALYEAMEVGGLFGPIRVGGGKTLLTLLLPLVLEARRPILLLPAALVEKTWRDYEALREHWRLPTNLQMISYEMLGLVQSAGKLDYIEPDFIEADECHFLKNHAAGRTRRVTRYMREHPETRFAAVSGTVMKASVKDFAHMLRWALKTSAPIPSSDDEIATWADALDEKVNPLARRQPGALLDLDTTAPRQEPVATSDFFDMARGRTTVARQVFQSRLLQTRGVVASQRTDGVTCSLRVASLEYEPAAITSSHIDIMRNGVKDATSGEYVTRPWSTPDGWSFSQPFEFRMYLRQLALGFHSVWDPRPPMTWITARRDWAAFVRDTLSESLDLDTELQVANAVDGGRLRSGKSLLAAWRAVRGS